MTRLKYIIRVPAYSSVPQLLRIALSLCVCTASCIDATLYDGALAEVSLKRFCFSQKYSQMLVKFVEIDGVAVVGLPSLPNAGR
jgi:hypothetical protein